LLAALRGEGSLPAIRNDLQQVVEPEVESVRAGLGLLSRAQGAVAVAMSGSGPSLFALFPDRSLAEQARADLAAPLSAGWLRGLGLPLHRLRCDPGLNRTPAGRRERSQFP